MKYLPITLIIVLGSSLFVALVINPVLAVVFMKLEQKVTTKKRIFRLALILFVVGVLLALLGVLSLGNLLIIFAIIVLINYYVFTPGTKVFQERFLPRLENFYARFFNEGLVRKESSKYLVRHYRLILLLIRFNGHIPSKSGFFPRK